MGRALIIAFVMIASPAMAKDVALTLNDQEQALFRQVIDAAAKGKGIEVLLPAAYLLNRLNTAPTIQSVQELPKEEPKKPVEEPKHE